MHRRTFLRQSLVLSAAAAALPAFAINDPIRKFRLDLNPGLVGVKANFAQTLDYAIQYGYESISPFVQEAMDNYSEGQIDELRGKMAKSNITFGSTNIPVEFRKDHNSFMTDFKKLEKFCQTMHKLGATRINTWIISSHNTLTYMENMDQHAARLGECARVMADYNISLGLEYLGMRTLLNMNKYPFISSIKEAKDLIAATGQKNVGLVLDTFHWYCAGETLEDIKALRAEEIIIVDLNDARAGFTRTEQLDGKREMPLSTGVINIKEFIQGLLSIGYAGPVRTEPFNEAINAMDDDAALQLNLETMKKALALAGV
jgi:sugar phosphate isomerase/epimerase